MAPLEVVPAEAGAERRAFVAFPYEHFRDEPRWIPPLRFDVKNRLDRRKNPFFQHSDAAYFIARRGKKVVGRIAAILNRRHQETHEDRTGFFGWFDFVDDSEVVKALLSRANEWLKERGCDLMRGPASFSLNDECGLLVEGFDTSTVMMTTWNPPYYEERFRDAGLEGVMDLVSFFIAPQIFDHDRVGRIANLVRRKEGATIRRFDPQRYDEEVERIMALYNTAWEDNWGFVPMTEAELAHMAKELKPALIPEYACFCEIEGEAIGFSLVLPDINRILAKLKGRLFPTGLFRLLFGVKRINDGRLLAMGIDRRFHKRGLDALMYYDNFQAARDRGMTDCELGWVLATNQVMINTIGRMGGSRKKCHRMFESTIH